MKTISIVAVPAFFFWAVTGSFALDIGVGGVSVGVGSGTSGGGSETGGVDDDSSGGSPETTRSVAGGDDASAPIRLPDKLHPKGEITSGKEHPDNSATGADSNSQIVTASIPNEVLNACRETLTQAAQSYGLVEATVASYGATTQMDDGGQMAYILARLTYQREGGYEVREAPIWCQIEENGVVSALSDS